MALLAGPAPDSDTKSEADGNGVTVLRNGEGDDAGNGEGDTMANDELSVGAATIAVGVGAATVAVGVGAATVAVGIGLLRAMIESDWRVVMTTALDSASEEGAVVCSTLLIGGKVELGSLEERGLEEKGDAESVTVTTKAGVCESTGNNDDNVTVLATRVSETSGEVI